jgi:hypothetical protein
MDIKIVGEEPVKSETQVIEPVSKLSAPVLPELQEKAIHQVMGFEKESETHLYKHDIQILLDYAKSQTKDHSPENLKWIIRSLELKLGTPPLAEKRIKWLARYAYLSMESKKIEDEKKQFEQL